MKINQMVNFLIALEQWRQGTIPLSDVSLILGDDDNALGQMLMLNAVADFNYKPMEAYSFQAVVNVCLLFLSMRYAVKQSRK